MRYLFILVIQLISLLSMAEQNTCRCMPLPESKKYIGDARQRESFGYRIHWTCDYVCFVGQGQDEVKKTMRATYNEKFYGAENGLEGICEGMTYESVFNSTLNREIYMWEGKKVYFNPMRSSSPGLKKWAEQMDCRGGGWFD